MRKSRRKFLTLFLTITLAVAAVQVTPHAMAEAMTTSETGITFIKNYEGFRSHVYWDSGSAFIGYGTICKSTDYPDGITREKADELLREALRVKENTVNKFLVKYNIQLRQNQFDALMSFTYNLGTIWMSSGNRIYNYLINGIGNYNDIQIVNAIATWCHQGKQVNSMLVKRRIDEAKMFLYNDYDGSDPHDYKYLTFDAGQGTVDYSIVFFETGKPYGEIQTPKLDGYTFSGWYTAGGVRIVPTMTVTNNLAVSAVWTKGTTPVQNGAFADVTVNDWFYTSVTELSASNIVKGYPDGLFRPNNTVTCGEALKLILLAVGFDQQTPTGSHWASGYLTLAFSKGIVNNGEIGNLDAAISRQMIAQIAAKAMGLPAIDTPETTFKDTADGFVLALYHCGIVQGSTETGSRMYYPDSSIKRSEVSAVIWRIYNSDLMQQ